jgi:hypothetical protein
MIGFILAGLAILIYVLQFVGSTEQGSWFAFVSHPPIPAIADALLASAVVAIVFETLVHREFQRLLSDTIRTELAVNRQDLLNQFPKLLLNKDIQRELLKTEALHAILRDITELLAGESVLADAMHAGFFKKILKYKERWTNYQYDVLLSDITTHATPEIKKLFYEVVVHIRYETILKKSSLAFVAARSTEEFNELLADEQYETRWLCSDLQPYSRDPEDSFKVLGADIDGVPLNIYRPLMKQWPYTVRCSHDALDRKIERPVTVTYSFVTKVKKSENFLFTTVVHPTSKLTISFDCSQATLDRRSVDVVDYFFSPAAPHITRLPNADEPRKIIVEVADWVFPKGGAVFTWSQ